MPRRNELKFLKEKRAHAARVGDRAQVEELKRRIATIEREERYKADLRAQGRRV